MHASASDLDDYLASWNRVYCIILRHFNAINSSGIYPNWSIIFAILMKLHWPQIRFYCRRVCVWRIHAQHRALAYNLIYLVVFFFFVWYSCRGFWHCVKLIFFAFKRRSIFSNIFESFVCMFHSFDLMVCFRVLANKICTQFKRLPLQFVILMRSI